MQKITNHTIHKAFIKDEDVMVNCEIVRRVALSSSNSSMCLFSLNYFKFYPATPDNAIQIFSTSILMKTYSISTIHEP